MEMKHVPVKSSQVKSVGYHPEYKTLAVTFHGGAIYQYHDVPADIHARMMKAESIGKFLHAEIKGKFKHTKVEAKK